MNVPFVQGDDGRAACTASVAIEGENTRPPTRLVTPAAGRVEGNENGRSRGTGRRDSHGQGRALKPAPAGGVTQ